MTLKKGKEQDGMMLAKVKEQDGIMLANVKVPSIPTSAAWRRTQSDGVIDGCESVFGGRSPMK